MLVWALKVLEVDQRVLNNMALKGVSVVCLFPALQSIGTDREIPANDSTSLQLWREIKSHHLFTLVPIDSLKLVIHEQTKWDSTTTCKVAQSVGADAFIIAHFRYSKAPGEPVADLFLQLIDSHSDSVIAYAMYNTYLGNNHWWPPGFETVKSEAITGAVDVLANIIEKQRKK